MACPEASLAALSGSIVGYQGEDLVVNGGHAVQWAGIEAELVRGGDGGSWRLCLEIGAAVEGRRGGGAAGTGGGGGVMQSERRLD